MKYTKEQLNSPIEREAPIEMAPKCGGDFLDIEAYGQVFHKGDWLTEVLPPELRGKRFPGIVIRVTDPTNYPPVPEGSAGWTKFIRISDENARLLIAQIQNGLNGRSQ